jgi:predicted ATPase
VIQELYGRRQCEELALELLTEAEVEEYLARGFGCSAAVSALSKTIYNYTDGNALFVVNFVDYLLQRKLLIAVDGQWKVRAESTVLKDLVPETLQQLITWQIERLTLEEQHLLEVASVSGRTFSAVEVAKVMGRALEEVEEVYDALASTGQFIAGAGVMEWPDGTVTVRYKFRHALYQQVLSEQLGPGRRMRLHRQIGERKELGYGEQAGEIAGELAVHFMKGRDYRRAVRYHCQAGETALQRNAYQEAADHCQEGLDLLEQMPDTLERQQQELALQLLFSTVLTATGGFGAEGLVQNLSRARVLC